MTKKNQKKTTKKSNGKKKNKAIAKKDEFTSEVAILSLIEGMTPGMENVSAEDIMLPRLALVQGLSPMLDPDDPNAPTLGQFHHTGTMENYEAPVAVVPLFYNKAAAKFPPKEDRDAGIECMSRDAKKGNQYGECAECDYNWKVWRGDEPPACTEIHEFICVMADENPFEALPFVVSFMRTSSSAAKGWLRAARYAGANVSLFGVRYQIGRQSRQNDLGKYYVLTVKPDGKIDPRPYEPAYRMIATAHLEGRLQADYDGKEKDSDISFDPSTFDQS